MSIIANLLINIAFIAYQEIMNLNTEWRRDFSQDNLVRRNGSREKRFNYKKKNPQQQKVNFIHCGL